MADEQTAVPQEQPIPEDFREFKAFRETGKMPEPAKPAEAAESAPETQDQSANAGEQDAPKQEQEQEKSEPERDEHGKFKAKEPALTPEAQAAVDKRIAKAVAAQREAERKAAELEAKLAGRQAPEPEKTPKPAEQPAGAPKLEDYDSLESWIEARDAWKDAQRAAKDAENQQRTKAQTFMSAGAALPGVEDFNAIAKGVGEKVTPDVASAIVETSDPKVVKFLHDNPAELQRIGSLTGMKAALEVGALHARINQPAPETPKPVVSKAPKPPTPVGAAAAPVKPNIYSEDLDFRTYKALREAEPMRR